MNLLHNAWIYKKKYFFSFILFFSCNNNVSKKPNIIVFFFDDLGYGELGAYGQKIIQTKNIDKLSNSGVKFTNFYSGSPVCAPSRSIFLTGLHSGNTPIRGNHEYGSRGDVWDYHKMSQNLAVREIGRASCRERV